MENIRWVVRFCTSDLRAGVDTNSTKSIKSKQQFINLKDMKIGCTRHNYPDYPCNLQLLTGEFWAFSLSPWYVTYYGCNYGLRLLLIGHGIILITCIHAQLSNIHCKISFLIHKTFSLQLKTWFLHQDSSNRGYASYLYLCKKISQYSLFQKHATLNYFY